MQGALTGFVQNLFAEVAVQEQGTIQTPDKIGRAHAHVVGLLEFIHMNIHLLQQEVNIHMNKLQETYNMGMSSADFVGSLDRALLLYSNFSKKVLDETSQSSLHSDKIST